MYEGSYYSTSLSTFDVSLRNYSGGCVMVYHCGLTCICLMVNDVEHCFMFLLAIYISSLVKCQFKSFAF